MLFNTIKDALYDCHCIFDILNSFLFSYFVHEYRVANLKMLFDDLFHLFVDRFMGEKTVLVFTLED